MFSCWIQSSSSLLQSKLVEDPVAILQAAHSAAAQVWPWLLQIVVLVASPQSDVLLWGFSVWWTSRGSWEDRSVVSEAIPASIFPVALAVEVSPGTLSQAGNTTIILLQLSDVYDPSLIACLSLFSCMTLQTTDLIWLCLFVVFQFIQMFFYLCNPSKTHVFVSVWFTWLRWNTPASPLSVMSVQCTHQFAVVGWVQCTLCELWRVL